MSMAHHLCPIESVRTVADNTCLLGFRSAGIARTVMPGQFVNLRTGDGDFPMLRRPFSVYRTDREIVEIIFNIVGRGTRVLSRKNPGEMLDVLGPLGVPFTVNDPQVTQAILVAGGLGVAPLPLLTAALRSNGKNVTTYLGARTKSQLVETHLENLRVATDDGSKGMRGTVVDLLRKDLKHQKTNSAKIFCCGPTAMLRGVAAFAGEAGIACEASLEGQMGCGFGICQGCPVELEDAERKYALMCKDGPVFDVRRIRI